MHRRAAAAVVVATVLGGCGGGGGGVSVRAGGDSPAPAPGPAPAPAPAPEPAPAPPPAPAFRGSPNIAAWGDSLTPPVAANLQLLYPNRVVFNGGVAGETSTQIAARQLADTSDHNIWINIFWYGHNNQTQAAQIKADIAASVAALAPGNTRFVVLAVVNQATLAESKGGADYATIIQLNSELASLYPQNYLDIRAHLVNGYNPANAQDVADFQNDVVPSSLRFDPIHLNNDGSVLVAQKVRDFIDAKGW